MNNEKKLIEMAQQLAKEAIVLESMCLGNTEEAIKVNQLTTVAALARMVCCDDGMYNPDDDIEPIR
ncbi:MAG: hypothetical protein ACUZ8H_02185 [Candidatus Anammoxibacter sp.]